MNYFVGIGKLVLDLSNYARKIDLRGAIDMGTSTLASKTDLTSLKTQVDNLDVDKQKTFLLI